MASEKVATCPDPSWFVHDRFGLFIHWGIYALPARHEWVKHRERITNEGYQKYFDHFDPDLYDPHVWAAAAARAGMKYFVATTRSSAPPRPTATRPSTPPTCAPRSRSC